LIKFKRPVRSVSVTTLNEDQTGTSVTRVGDREPAQRFSSTESVAAVQTIADVKPTVASPPKAITDLLSDEPVQKKMSVQALLSDPAPVKSSKTEPVCIVKPETALNAYFVRDAVVDGTKIPASERFVQVWTLQNPGPATWPAGCSVRHVGGDNMLNIDNNQPLSQSELALASETNVIDRSVAPGEDVNFRIIMKAPAREGTAISYWRIKTADGMPFGHRLWCDIQVVAPVPSYPQFVLPVRNAEVGEASSSKFPTSSERHPLQNKMEHIRAMRTTLQNRAQNARQSGHQEDIHRRVQEAVERTNKARKSLDEKENQVSMLAKIEREKMLRIQQIRKLGVERLLETRRKEYETHAAQQQQEKTVNSLAKEQTMEEMITEVRRQRLNLIAPQPPMEQAKATEQSVDRENVMRHAQAAEQTKATQQARERAEAIQKEHAMEHMKAVQQAQAMAQTKAMEQAKSTEQTKAMIEQAKEQAKAFVSTEAHSQPSAMIFPQLEKESPASSTHEAMTVQPQSPRPEDASVSSSIAEEFFEDAESVDIRSINSDDGFMTDEEYDILDASDEEMP
jgi:next-to-BRCA1 protein 1